MVETAAAAPWEVDLWVLCLANLFSLLMLSTRA
jgi:hypothetical protein